MSLAERPLEESSSKPIPQGAESESRDSADSPTRPRRVPKKKTLAGKIGRSSLMLVRRVHLYSGIFMFPWVLLYGFTGWFFNHPQYFSGDEVVSFDSSELQIPALASMPTAQETAEDVVLAMNLDSASREGPTIELTETRSPEFSGYFSYSVSTDDASHQIRIHPETGDGEIRTTFRDSDFDDRSAAPPNPFASIRTVKLPENSLLHVKAAGPDILAELDLDQGDASMGRRSPSLLFSAKADGVPCLVTYNLGSGSVSAVREDSRPTMEAKSFLQRLHLSRTYSPGIGVRWIWALLVDAMFLSMVFWGVSGLMMWWQVKRTRFTGAGVLFASIAFASMMGFGMHDRLTSSAPRGRGGGRPSEAAAKPSQVSARDSSRDDQPSRGAPPRTSSINPSDPRSGRRSARGTRAGENRETDDVPHRNGERQEGQRD